MTCDLKEYLLRQGSYRRILDAPIQDYPIIQNAKHTRFLIVDNQLGRHTIECIFFDNCNHVYPLTHIREMLQKISTIKGKHTFFCQCSLREINFAPQQSVAVQKEISVIKNFNPVKAISSEYDHSKDAQHNFRKIGLVALLILLPFGIYIARKTFS